ncbi:MAG: MarR family winged helix-turn-helix transcriptional regulator [Faecousia sp.]
MNGILKSIYVGRELHTLLFAPVCRKYGVTLTEILILLYLSSGDGRDTATDIVEGLKLAKSHVSVSVRNLEARGYLTGSYAENNHRTIHLRVCPAAEALLAESSRVQSRLLAVTQQGFTEEERAMLDDYIRRMTENMNLYLQTSEAGTDRRCRAGVHTAPAER